MALDEFYSNIRSVGVSAVSGCGMDKFIEALPHARQEYIEEYKVEYERLWKERRERDESRKNEV